MSGYYNPYTKSYSWEDDLRDHPGCRDKILAIAKRLQMNPKEITYNDIVFLCTEFGTLTQADFMARIAKMTDEELKEALEKARRRRKGFLNYLNETVAVPNYIS